jgi:hypothetical protein
MRSDPHRAFWYTEPFVGLLLRDEVLKGAPLFEPPNKDRDDHDDLLRWTPDSRPVESLSYAWSESHSRARRYSFLV